MPNPRNIISFEEIGVEYRTFLTDNVTILFDATKPQGSVSAGIKLAVTFSAAGTVALAADADAIVGRLEKVEADNKATVAVKGCIAFRGGTAATLVLGTQIVGALLVAAKGYIRGALSAVPAELLKGRGQIYHATDVTNVVVEL